MLDNRSPIIFLSYSWANVAVADEIDSHFQKIGIQFKRDVRDLAYRKSIKDFMNQVGKSDFVLMIISDEYLKSENCMYEIMELLNTHKFEERGLPIVIENAKHIFKAKERLQYYDYWKTKLIESKHNKTEYPNIDTIDYSLKCQRINDSLPDFFKKVTDLNLSTFHKLKQNNYNNLLKVIGYDDKIIIRDILRISEIEDPEVQEIELDNFLKKYPHNKLGVFQKAYLAKANAQYKKAKNYYEECLKIDSESASIHYNIGNLLKQHFSDFETAKWHFSEAIRINPQHINALLAMALLFQNHFSDFETAKHYYEQAIQINPLSSEAHNNFANLLATKLKDYDSARHHYDQAIQINPKLASAHNNFGNLLKRVFSDFEKAKYHYLQAIKCNAKYTDAHFNLALLLEYNIKDFEKSKYHYEQALTIDPTYYKARNNLTHLLQQHFQ